MAAIVFTTLKASKCRNKDLAGSGGFLILEKRLDVESESDVFH